MAVQSVLSGEFLELAVNAIQQARKRALAAGHAVVSVDEGGRCIEEHPDGRRFEILLDPTKPIDDRKVILRELEPSTA